MEHTYELVLCHHGVKGMKWGVRKDLKAKLGVAKAKYKKLKDDAFGEYEKTIADIERPYKSGQTLSKKDLDRQSAAEMKYREAYDKAKFAYRAEKRKLKLDAKKKISEIENSPEGIAAAQRGKRAATNALKIGGGLAAASAAAVALYPATALGWAVVKMARGA